eukprot:scaffold41387_cov22-Prasinocladus_malaysianus.AAC.1
MKVAKLRAAVVRTQFDMRPASCCRFITFKEAPLPTARFIACSTAYFASQMNWPHTSARATAPISCLRSYIPCTRLYAGLCPEGAGGH